MKRYFLLVLPLFFLASPTLAQNWQSYALHWGTGFFVNRQDVITNAHVVEGCREVTIKGAVPEHKALVKFLDREHDLAVIESEVPPPEFAPLRYNIDALKTGDKVMIIGYPGTAGSHGEYTVANAQVEDIQIDEDSKNKWLFISDVVNHGNSGGPVFDTSGNVIGVVVAKATITATNAVTHEPISEQRAGVVIPLKTLGQFLFNNGVFTALSGSGVIFNDSYLEERARNYIVNVQCLIKN